MTAWSNIECSPKNAEIARIDELEKSLGALREPIQEIRELITRFEVCHFKYERHFQNIVESIENLKPAIGPSKIGAAHLRHGEKAWTKDPTGRSLLGQQYLKALDLWLGEADGEKKTDPDEMDLDRNVKTWLGYHTADKERLVRLLIARLTWNWEPYENLQEKGEWEPLEQQICRMDICHFTFPDNLDRLLQGIGTLTTVEDFTGCGTINKTIETYFKAGFSKLCEWLKANAPGKQGKINKAGRTKFWLTACLAKTVKEQLGLRKSLPLG